MGLLIASKSLMQLGTKSVLQIAVLGSERLSTPSCSHTLRVDRSGIQTPVRGFPLCSFHVTRISPMFVSLRGWNCNTISGNLSFFNLHFSPADIFLVVITIMCRLLHINPNWHWLVFRCSFMRREWSQLRGSDRRENFLCLISGTYSSNQLSHLIVTTHVR